MPVVLVMGTVGNLLIFLIAWVAYGFGQALGISVMFELLVVLASMAVD